MLLFKLGYPELNKGFSFQVKIERKGYPLSYKKISVFAKDDETIIIADCISAEKLKPRNLQSDITEIANHKGPISTAIKNHYGASIKFKIIWLIVTENIIWKKSDRETAETANIRIITEKELRYFSQIAEHIGRAARYQFLAEFLKDQSIPGLVNKKVPAIKGKLGGKLFYCFATTPRHLLKIAFVNHRSLSDPDGAPAYQRLISRSRLKDVAAYIKGGGFFPNNLLVNFTRELRFEKMANAELSDVTFGMLHLPSSYRSAWIIDGQHRLYGFSPADDKHLDQNIIVVAFEKLPMAEEAALFVTINHEQKTVPKHLLDDLEGELKWGSEVPSERIGAIASRLINYLNTDIDEPFHGRVTQQGIKSTLKTCLTIPGIKETIIATGLIGRSISKDSIYEPGPLSGKNDSETLDRARDAFNQFFKIICLANPTQWERGREGYLSNNVGVQAYIRLLASLIKYWQMVTGGDARNADPSELVSEIEEYLDPLVKFLSAATDEIMKERFTVVLGSSGPVTYFYRLSQIIKSARSDFEPEGLATYEAEQSDERFTSAADKLRKIEEEVNRFVFDIFKTKYGIEKNAYWNKGVLDNKIKVEAYGRQVEDDMLSPIESYINLIDYKKIVEHRDNWPVFKNAFNIPEKGEKGHAKNTSWIDRINELRRITSHPSPDRRFKLDDYEYIDWIHSEFMAKIAECRRDGLTIFLSDLQSPNS